jgi:D-alanyl-D-alanine carboxypeptidase/D-alanyl-D-alanine-endopeptidase (penicillin-binding protein 4)
LAPASTQKIITAATAFDLLGKDYRYVTKFGYTGKISGKSLQGNFYMKPSGDPTLGSWRWQNTTDSSVLDKMFVAIRKLNITSYDGITIDVTGWNEEVIPNGWIWQDIGNYYGAGASGLNWRENQYDVVLRSGSKIGSPVTIVKTKPEFVYTSLVSLAQSAEKGTGDNAYVYYPLTKTTGMIRGTIPINENAFVISAAFPDVTREFNLLISRQLRDKFKIRQVPYEKHLPDTTILFSHFSPSLDSIVYWFLKKSINLYGEALIKTFACEKKAVGSTDTGVEMLKDFWKQRGLDPAELNMKDGSGLSPQNRVTTHAQVEILKYAKDQSWFSYFLGAFPEYNKMKMKSGTISDVKGFCGYHTSAEGGQYIFSFIVNNYTGPSSALIDKMYKVLDVLK